MATIVDEAEQVNIKPKTRPRGTNAVKFLQQLRPKGPWVLTAIEPDGPTLTRTFTSKQSEDARQFIVERNDAGDNLYYSLNPTREAMTKKAAKQDIAAVEYLHVDIDPHDDESPDQCKQRALRQVEQFRNEPSFIIDSGNGLQLLWELTHPVELRDFADIGDLEARNHALADAFGADASTRNIDRILRLPGTVNHPNRKKRERGRMECRAELLQFNERIYSLAKFPPRSNEEDNPTPSRDETNSGYGWRFMRHCKALGLSFEQTWNCIVQDPGQAGKWARGAELRELRHTYERATPKRDPDFVMPKRKSWNLMPARKLETMTFAPLKFAVPDILVEGLTILAGKPKAGKSYLMLHAANAIAKGGKTLGGIRCEPGAVLYCALEDNHRRLENRRQLMGLSQWAEDLDMVTEMPRLDEGGLELIRDWLEKPRRRPPRLVVIDIFKRVRGRSSEGSAYDIDYESGRELHDLANEFGVAIVAIHHQRKLEADDPYDTVNATLGLTAVADTLLLLRRDNTGTTILQGRGRDLAEFEKAVAFNAETKHWKIVGEVGEVRQSQQRLRLVEAMREFGRAAKLQEIASAAGIKASNASRLLSKMARDGLIRRTDYGHYELEMSQNQ
jgi:hypothetical protein